MYAIQIQIVQVLLYHIAIPLPVNVFFVSQIRNALHLQPALVQVPTHVFHVPLIQNALPKVEPPAAMENVSQVMDALHLAVKAKLKHLSH